MRELRDLEDFARLTLNDDLLADRARASYEAILEDFAEMSGHQHSTLWRARLWDRYCAFRLHDAHAGAIGRNARLASRGR